MRGQRATNSMGWRTSFTVNLDERLGDLFGKWCAAQGFARGQEHNAIRLLLEEYFASTPDMGSAAWARSVAYKEVRTYAMRRLFLALDEIARDIKASEIDGGRNASQG